MSTQDIRAGELFLLGFRGYQIPNWMKEFAENYGLGGVILFDYDFQTKVYENNIESAEQLSQLCQEIHELPGHPLVYIDQEGGKVRRLKEKRGFAPLPSQWEMNQLSIERQEEFLSPSFAEMKQLGIDVNLAPVIDLNINPDNPDIGKVERSYSNSPEEISRNVEVLNQIAKKQNLGLCLKHFPGLGGATVNSHLELTDISDSVNEKQLQLFYQWAEQIHGQSILISHGMVQQWDPDLPCSISKVAVQKIREHGKDWLLLTDDLQMYGLQKKVNTFEACTKAIGAGIDLLCIGNNILDEEAQMLSLVAKVSDEIQKSEELKERYQEAIVRLEKQKKLLS